MLPILALIAPALACVAPMPPADEDHVKAKLVSEFDGVEPGGTLTLAAVFDIDKDWHIYWAGQNDTGQPPKFDTDKLPEGVTLGEIAWPVPHRHALPGDIVDHIYEKQAVLLLPVTIAPTVKPGQTLTIELPVEWMECASVCRIGGGTVKAEVRVVERRSDAKPASGKSVIEAARAAVPQPLPKDGSIKVEVTAKSVTFTAPGADAIAFMPHESSAELSDLANGATAKGETLTAALKADRSKLRTGTPIIGILSVGSGKSAKHYHVDTTPKPEKKAEKDPKTSPGAGADGTPAPR
jgi:DsbC/DsbD-like thiol-disulfide interchange protein